MLRGMNTSPSKPDFTAALEALAGGAAGTILFAFAVLLAIAALLMPLYVMIMSGHIRRIRKLQEQQLAELQAIRAATIAARRPSSPIQR